MTTLPDKTVATTLGLDKQAGLPWLKFALLILLAATMLSLPGGADAIHCAGGILLLIGCGVHLALHRGWINAVILKTPKNITPVLRSQRRLFWGMLISGILCGLSGLVTMPTLFCATPLHVLSGLVFLGLNSYHLVLHRNRFRKKLATMPAASKR